MITFTTPACPVCSKVSEMQLDPEQIQRWRDGEHIQNVFPELTANDCELMLSGTHPRCWDELFPEEEDD